MADTAEEKQAERSLWSLNRDDQRLLLVTLIGTLAANVITVVVIAGALLYERRIAVQLRHAQPTVAREAWFDVIAAAVLVPLLSWLLRLVRRHPLRGSRRLAAFDSFMRLAFQVMIGIMIAILIVTGIAFLGLAAGFK